MLWCPSYSTTPPVGYLGVFRTGIAAPCGAPVLAAPVLAAPVLAAPVLAAHDGTVVVRRDQPWAGPTLLQAATGPGQLNTWYAHLQGDIVGDTAIGGTTTSSYTETTEYGARRDTGAGPRATGGSAPRADSALVLSAG